MKQHVIIYKFALIPEWNCNASLPNEFLKILCKNNLCLLPEQFLLELPCKVGEGEGGMN